MPRFSRRAALATFAQPLLAPALLALAMLAPAMPTRAQEARPLRFVVPFAAGGSTDVLARGSGERIAALLGQFQQDEIARCGALVRSAKITGE